MRNLIMVMAFLVSLTLPAFAAYDQQSQPSSQSGTQKMSQPASQPSAQQNQPAARNAAQAAESDMLIRGKVISLDPNTESVTITDYVTGADRMFAVRRKEDLKDLKVGDRVNVTPEKANPKSAQKVEKEQ